MPSLKNIAIKASGKCMSKDMRTALRSRICPNTLWPYRNWLVNHEQRFIYCPIPKVACTSIKHWFMQTLGSSIEFEDISITHSHVDEHYSAARANWRLARKAINQYQRLAVVRNPWTRTVSGFIDKFVREDFNPQKAQVIEAIYTHRGHTLNRCDTLDWNTMGDTHKIPMDPSIPYQDGISFQEFSDYLCRTPDEQLDDHWRPQYLFLGRHDFQWILKFENLDKGVLDFEQALGVPHIALLRLHKACSKDLTHVPPLNRDVSAIPSGVLKENASQLSSQNLLNERLCALLGNRFATDVQQFRYTAPSLTV